MNAVKDFFARLFGARAVEQILSVEERFNAASATSTNALTMFEDVLSDLDVANVDLKRVEDEVSAEVARLTALAQNAARQYGQNSAVAADVRRLLRPAVEG